MNYDLSELGRLAGVHLPQGMTVQTLAMDSQSVMNTTVNGGIPAFLANYLDPKVIQTLLTPMRAAEIFGETKKGDWTTQSAQFITIEASGETSSYGDYSNNGTADVNANYPSRESYHYQVTTVFGDKEIAIASQGHIDLVNQKNIASVLTLNKFQNKTYLLGIQGLKCYGTLNDPALSAPIAPSIAWSNVAADGVTIYNDFVTLFKRLQTQVGGNITRDEKMTLVLSSTAETSLSKINSYNVKARDAIMAEFKNLRIVTVPEYSTQAGEVAQLIVDNVDGQDTGACAFTEKMRAHPVVRDLSSYRQKKSQGTFGAVIYRPVCIVQMLGV